MRKTAFLLCRINISELVGLYIILVVLASCELRIRRCSLIVPLRCLSQPPLHLQLLTLSASGSDSAMYSEQQHAAVPSTPCRISFSASPNSTRPRLPGEEDLGGSGSTMRQKSKTTV